MPSNHASNIFVVITDFNGYQQTRRCLEALLSSSFLDFQTVIVDHGTTNQTANGLERDFPECLRISASSDMWWAGAVNVGVRYALSQDASAVILLNNDCYVEFSTIEVIVSECLVHQDSIIAPVQKDLGSGKISSITPGSCLLLGFPTRPGPLKLTTELKSRPLLPTTLIVGGRGVIIPSAVFKALGLFDELELPHYGADHDFYFRARSLGVNLYVSTRAFVGIDDARTSSAKNSGELSRREFFDTLVSIRSHRSFTQISALFRKHYPIKRLYMVGVFLYEVRYVSVYIANRISNFLNDITWH
jgi:GT2 family glycosyltransferase